MSMPGKTPRPILSRIFSLEGAIAAFGLYSLGSGLWQEALIPVFWGVTILGGLIVLSAVRRRDWQKHWELQGKQGQSPPPNGSEPPPS